jgi:type VI secretion system protein
LKGPARVIAAGGGGSFVAIEGSLLERIDRPEEGGYRLQSDSRRVTESVLEHLRKMLNVRQGSVTTLPDYGIPDLNDLFSQYPDPVPTLRRILKESLEKYEPRLRRVSVRYVRDEDNPLGLRFDITARLAVDDQDAPLQFETLIGDNGRVKVRG